MQPARTEQIIFDFKGVDSSQKLIENISGVAQAGACVWIASDERRSLECFTLKGGTYVLKQQLFLDDVFDGLPNSKNEADLEGLAFDGEHLWLCGSHCRSRAKPLPGKPPDPKIRHAANRHVLGKLKLAADGTWDGGKGRVLSTAGEGALRKALRTNRILAPFLDLPAKENGLDIEGLAIIRGHVALGLRGPVIAGRAIILDLNIDAKFKLKSVAPRFLDLGGLGIRDLYSAGRKLIVLAGPTFPSDAPFCLFTLGATGEPKHVTDLPSGKNDHPEAITMFKHDGRAGMLMLSDGKARAKGLRYHADWFPLPLRF